VVDPPRPSSRGLVRDVVGHEGLQGGVSSLRNWRLGLGGGRVVGGGSVYPSGVGILSLVKEDLGMRDSAFAVEGSVACCRANQPLC